MKSKFIITILAINGLLCISSISQKATEDWLDEGNALYNQGKYDEAVKAYDKAIELDHNNALAWYNKGIAFGTLGEYDEAMNALKKVVELNPDPASLADQAKLDNMEKAFAEAIRLAEISKNEMEKKSVRNQIAALMDFFKEIQRTKEQSYTSTSKQIID